jgi:hypothetical protein
MQRIHWSLLRNTGSADISCMLLMFCCVPCSRAKADRVKSGRDASVLNDRHRDGDRPRDRKKDHSEPQNTEAGQFETLQMASQLEHVIIQCPW